MIDQKEKQELEERLKYVIKDYQELNRKIDIIEDAIASISCNKTLSEEYYTNMLAFWALRNQLSLLMMCALERERENHRLSAKLGFIESFPEKSPEFTDEEREYASDVTRRYGVVFQKNQTKE